MTFSLFRFSLESTVESGAPRILLTTTARAFSDFWFLQALPRQSRLEIPRPAKAHSSGSVHLSSRGLDYSKRSPPSGGFGWHAATPSVSSRRYLEGSRSPRWRDQARHRSHRIVSPCSCRGKWRSWNGSNEANLKRSTTFAALGICQSRCASPRESHSASWPEGSTGTSRKSSMRSTSGCIYHGRDRPATGDRACPNQFLRHQF
jgi:hypothetical protein